jgi:drug/metabolite transporter (DMT)-like permease
VQRSAIPYIVLAAGVLIASTAAIMITALIDQGVAPITVAAGRIGFAALILTPITLARAHGEVRRIGRRDWFAAIVAGVFLAIHFAAWITSLAYTSVASSTALVTTNPVFVALATSFVFRERLPLGTWVGVLITVGGSMLIAISDSAGGGGSNPLYGDALALLGAVTVSGYFLIGRTLRVRISILPYIWIVYGTAALVLLLMNSVSGQSLRGLSPLAYGLMLALAIGPQLLGHTAFNWSIKYLSATLVTVGILGEPIGSAILAFVILRQPVQPLQVLGGATLLVGIAVAALAERRALSSAALHAEVEAAP